MAAPAGIDVAAVTGWLTEHAPAVEPPIAAELITGGLSNLTFLLADAAGRRWVLRRPPLGHVLATAHDVAREHRIVHALQPTPVPVPPLVGLCEDLDVIGAPFYVMDHVDGLVLRDPVESARLPLDARRRAGESLVDVLAEIHAVDVDAVGLGELGRREAYVERQLNRWQRQWEATRDAEVPVVDALHDRLATGVPAQGPATIVHGDYRIDNCILSPDGEVAAVLDWELCTLGDPLADVGLMLVYWSEVGDPHPTGLATPTAVEGYALRTELVERYAARTGRDVAPLGYHVALGYWKLACILQGVLVRYREGAMGDQAAGSRSSEQVVALAEAGMAALDGEVLGDG